MDEKRNQNEFSSRAVTVILHVVLSLTLKDTTAMRGQSSTLCSQVFSRGQAKDAVGVIAWKLLRHSMLFFFCWYKSF